MTTASRNRLVIVARADPVICGHSGRRATSPRRPWTEASTRCGSSPGRSTCCSRAGCHSSRWTGCCPTATPSSSNARHRWVTTRCPDGRYLAGLTGRLVELFTDGVPTLCISLYLSPHAVAVTDAVRVARSTGLPINVTTVAEAVGSDVTNVVRSCVEGRWGAAAHVLSSYLAHDVCLAVSEYTREIILAEAAEIDARHGTTFAERCREQVSVSYPAIDVGSYLSLDPPETERVMARRGLDRDGYVLFLSRLSPAKGVDDLIAGFARSRAAEKLRLVIAGSGRRPNGCVQLPRRPRSPRGSRFSTTWTTPRSLT